MKPFTHWTSLLVFVTVAFMLSTEGYAQLPEDSHVVVRTLRRSPPVTDIEISRAVLYMTRIERWDEVGRYLDQLAKLPIDEATAMKIERAAGLATWFKLAGLSDKLSEPQRAVAQKIIDAASGAARNPSKLLNAVELLNSKDLIDRKRGVLAIQASGEVGLAFMLESVVNSDKPPAPIISETIVTLGAEGESALKAAISTSDRMARERLILVAARIPGSAYMAELTAALYSVAPESDVYRQISNVLSPLGQALPQTTTAQRFILHQMEAQLKEFQFHRREISADTNSLWRWSSDGKRLLTELDDKASLHLERAFQLANLALHLKNSSGADASLATAITLERNHRLSPMLEQDPEHLKHMFPSWNERIDLDFLGSVLEEAQKAGLVGAQLRVVQAIGLELKKSPNHSAATIRRLSETVKNGPPPIRYASVAALSQSSDTEGNFEGKYRFDQTKLEMQRLESKPLALVIGGSQDLRDVLSKQLSELGIRTLGAASAREALRLIQEPQPIELVFLVDRVLEMPISELLQRIRSFPRTSSLPMAIMTDHFGSTQRSILKEDGFQSIHYSSVTSNIDLTGALLSEMRGHSPIPAMDSIDRLLFRSLAEPVTK